MRRQHHKGRWLPLLLLFLLVAVVSRPAAASAEEEEEAGVLSSTVEAIKDVMEDLHESVLTVDRSMGVWSNCSLMFLLLDRCKRREPTCAHA